MLQLPLFLPIIWFSFICCNIHCTFSTNVQFFLSTIPFYFGVYGVVVCFAMPLSLHDVLKFLKLYSPPPSHLIALIFFSIQFSTKALNTLSLSNTPNLVFMVLKNVSLKNHQWKVVNRLPLHEILPWDHISLCAQAQEFPLHKNFHLKEIGYDGVYNSHICHKNSSHGHYWNPCFQQNYFFHGC